MGQQKDLFVNDQQIIEADYVAPSKPEERQQAHARRSDPETSHEAAASIPSEKITEAQAAILAALIKYGPMTDAAIAQKVMTVITISSSGCRTRRSELVARGKVKDSGQRVKYPSGRFAILWEVA